MRTRQTGLHHNDLPVPSKCRDCGFSKKIKSHQSVTVFRVPARPFRPFRRSPSGMQNDEASNLSSRSPCPADPLLHNHPTTTPKKLQRLFDLIFSRTNELPKIPNVCLYCRVSRHCATWPMDKGGVYVLALQTGAVYVGKSHNVQERVAQPEWRRAACLAGVDAAPGKPGKLGAE